jgi:5'-3' exonuclease
VVDVTDSRVLLAVDGNSLVHRSFHALAATGMRSPQGEPIWAVRGLLTQLVAAVERIGPTAVVVGFDDAEASIRRDRWPHYKATRTEKLDTLVQQLNLAVIVLADLGIHVVVPTGLEADDVLASAVRHAGQSAARTVIMTSDRDSFSLIDENTSVLRIINGGVEASPMLSSDRLFTLLGVRPHQYRDFAALRGDPSDNLPGVRGIGPKTAAKLLNALGSAKAAFDDLADGGGQVLAAIGPGATARLADPAARATWELNCQIMHFHAEVALGLSFESGPGLLPLDQNTVRTTFTAHQLPATLPTALRALAHVDTEPAPVAMATAQNTWPADSVGSAERAGQWRKQRYGRIPAKPQPPKSEQLSLFG